MTVKDIVTQIEMLYGRRPYKYVERLINDGLLEISTKKQHYTVSAKADLIAGTRWYELPSRTVDIVKVEILDGNNRYNLIPKLADPHKLLKSDPESGTGDIS